MGVPKFYRWLSERYPCLSQVVKDYQIPEFDNLYLDMNGIIHPCSHPNDDDPHFRITEEQIFLNIFHYIEVLFRIIKPQKVFFMAVDGVAPRAKMNQQRSRRFRSAREAEESIKKAKQKGETLPSEARFDSNCITPGTEFMVRLHEQLKYFVNKKISTDPGWQGLKIYLSGHETPGEGEHKIMDFIRYERSQPDYDPNTRHCLYGLDADLIILGLTSHDPHFSLLREEIKFGKNVKRINNPEDLTFHLLHLSLLREYIDWEFESLKDKISFGYDLEKIIDDWILMGFLVGNDFIPNLPNLHINHDALPYLWQIYKDIMPSLDGYLHDGGTLSLQRFANYITTVAKFDLETFEDKYIDLKWLEGKTAQTDEEELSEQSEVDGNVASTSCEQSNMSPETGKEKRGKLLDYLEEKGELDDEEDDGDFNEEHEKYKLKYYREKFQRTDDDNCEELVKELSFKYIEAIQWILHYYFDGVPSWGWFYPFHYAPYVSDIKDFQDHPFSFNIGQPFLPFEQLLAVLPAASKTLLPEPFRSLMIMDNSPIIDFYPPKFETDINGKRQDWEAVVLIPFIDEKRLLEAMEPLYPRLKKSEKDRNKHSSCLLYTHEPEKSEHYPSSLPGIFPDLECCRANCETIPIDKYRLPSSEIVKGILPDVKLDVYFPGFPTLKHISHSGELKKIGVKVFQMHSRGESMVLKIDETDELNLKEVADSLLGKPCYVGWPHLIEAFITKVSDDSKKYVIVKDSPENIQEVTLTESDSSAWKKQVSCEKQTHIEKKGVDIGMTHILVEACQIQGKKYVCGTKGEVVLEKKWSDWAVAYPLQVTIKNINVCDETDAGAQCATVADLFPVGTECFMMAIPHYGSTGKVIEVDSKTNRVRVQLTVIPEPDLVSLIANKDDFVENYIPARIMAKRLGITSHALAQITGKVFIAINKKENSSKVDIGLNLKFSKQDKEVLGYARRDDAGWTYSPKTEQAISMYQEKFPQVFDVLSNYSSDTLSVSDVFPDNEKSKTLSEVEKWLKTLPSHKQKAVSCGSSTLDEPIVKHIEEAIEKLKEEKRVRKNVKVRVKPSVLYRPMKESGQVPPDPDANFELFDRVVNVRTLGVAPYGLKGTIVGIHKGKSEKDPVNYEVLFDEPFMGGHSLRGSSAFENKLYVIPAWSLLNLSYGSRLECKKKGIPSPLVQAKQKRQHGSGSHNKGVPAEYKPSNRGGAYHRDFYSAWQTPPANSGRQHTTPNGRTPNSNERTPNSNERRLISRPRFESPEFKTSVYRPRFVPRWNSPRNNLGNSPQNTQPSSQNSSGFHQQSQQSDDSRTALDSKDQLSAQETERVIRQLLNLNGSQGTQSNPGSPQVSFNTPDNAFMTPSLSPVSPLSSNPSALLVSACRQNRWPDPTFRHHRIAQHVISTVFVAGKLFQGIPFPTIEDAAESAAHFALMALFPQLNSSFVFPPLPNVPCPTPTRQPQLTDVNQRHERTFSKPTQGYQNIKSDRPTDPSSGQTQNPFVPLQVTLKRKDAVSTTSTKTMEQKRSVNQNLTNIQEPANIEQATTHDPTDTREEDNASNQGNTQDPDNVPDPSDTRDPDKTEDPENTLDQGNTQDSDKTKYLDNAQDQGKTKGPGKTQDPGNAPDQRNDQNSDKTQDSGNATDQGDNPDKTQDPGNATDQGNDQVPDKTQDPGNATDQGDDPDKTQDPGNATDQGDDPDKTQDSGNATDQGSHQVPDKTQDPENIAYPDNTKDSVNTKDQDNTKDPNNAKDTVKTRDSANTHEETNTLKDIDVTGGPNQGESFVNEPRSMQSIVDANKEKPKLLAPSFFMK